jgi:hypothetical protein
VKPEIWVFWAAKRPNTQISGIFPFPHMGGGDLLCKYILLLLQLVNRILDQLDRLAQGVGIE